MPKKLRSRRSTASRSPIPSDPASAIAPIASANRAGRRTRLRAIPAPSPIANVLPAPSNCRLGSSATTASAPATSRPMTSGSPTSSHRTYRLAGTRRGRAGRPAQASTSASGHSGSAAPPPVPAGRRPRRPGGQAGAGEHERQRVLGQRVDERGNEDPRHDPPERAAHGYEQVEAGESRGRRPVPRELRVTGDGEREEP